MLAPLFAKLLTDTGHFKLKAGAIVNRETLITSIDPALVYQALVKFKVCGSKPDLNKLIWKVRDCHVTTVWRTVACD